MVKLDSSGCWSNWEQTKAKQKRSLLLKSCQQGYSWCWAWWLMTTGSLSLCLCSVIHCHRTSFLMRRGFDAVWAVHIVLQIKHFLLHFCSVWEQNAYLRHMQKDTFHTQKLSAALLRVYLNVMHTHTVYTTYSHTVTLLMERLCQCRLVQKVLPYFI